MIHPDLQSWLMTHPVHAYPSDPQSFYLGRWHHHRLALSGVKTEAIKRLKARLRAPTAPRKLLVFGRPRSGTTLLGKIMGQVPGVHDEGEYLHFGHFSPLRSLEACAHTTPCEVFVAKLLSYQMLEVQQIADGYGFFKQLRSKGYSFLHIRRNSFNQALSLCTARATGHYFVEKDAAMPEQRAVEIDPDAFIAELRRTMMMLAYEDLLMSGFEHIAVQYETDLRDATRHQATADRICDTLGQPPHSVSATIPRTGGAQGHFQVTNREVLEARVFEEGLERALSDHQVEQRTPPRRRQAAGTARRAEFSVVS